MRFLVRGVVFDADFVEPPPSQTPTGRGIPTG